MGVESCGGVPKMDSFTSPYSIPLSHQLQPNPNYACPCRIIDRPVHNQCRGVGYNFPNGQHHECLPETKRFHTSCAQEKSGDHPSPFLKYQIYKNRHQQQQDDLINVNFDWCDLTPNDKFDWEYIHQHRRSKSYDIYDKKVENHLSSPRTKQKLFKPATGIFPNPGNPSLNATKQDQSRGVPSSPNHHYRHRHREREHQRAMQQVANWIEKEHLGGMDPEEVNPSKPSRKSPLVVERHEHHHLHEHVHHHYHHYVEN